MRARCSPLLPLFALWLALVSAPAAQPTAPIESGGPFAVGVSDVVFSDAIFGQGTIRGRLYYPAATAGEDAAPDPSGGPFPLVAFQHGYLGRPENYDALCAHVAGWGFVVASTGTETGLFPDQPQYARDTRSLLHYTDARASDPADPFFGMAADGPWAAAGHSMGGGVLPLLIGIEPRVRTIIGLQSAFVNDVRVDYLNAFTGNHYQIAGSVDRIVPPGQVERYFDEATAARRSVYFEVQGMGHSGCTDDTPTNEPLPAPEQQRLHRRLVTGLLRAELKGEENLYAEMLGEGIESEPVEFETRCPNPPLWVRPSADTPDALVVGTAGTPGDEVALAWSDQPASISTPYGEIGIRLRRDRVLYQGPAQPDGTGEALLTAAELGDAASVYVQGRVRDGAVGSVTRVEVRTSPLAPSLLAPSPPATLAAAPAGFRLVGNHPNPFAGATTVSYELPRAGTVELVVYDVLGRRVRVLVSGERVAGPHEAVWDGRDDAGRPAAAGLYLYRLRADRFSDARTMVRAE